MSRRCQRLWHLAALSMLLMWQALAPAAAAVRATQIDEGAELRYFDSRLGAQVVQKSNAVVAMSWPVAPTIQFYTDGQYHTRAWFRNLGEALFVQVTAAACNRDTTRAETITIRLQSWSADYVQHYTAVETAPSSGVYRIPGGVRTLDLKGAPRTAPGDWQGVMAGDAVTASLQGCNGLELATNVLIQPGGTVFDAVTGEPVAGARVSLIDVTGAGNGGVAGGAARVLGYDGTTPAPSEVTSGPDGRYVFPYVGASEYRLSVEPPVLYSFPSALARAQWPPKRVRAAAATFSGSFGGAFPVNAQTGAVTLDLPLDPRPLGLSVQKMASRTTAEIAETVEWSITVRNVGDLALRSVQVHDQLPVGFEYLPGSARLDDKPLADPRGGRGPVLDFGVGNLAVGAGKLLRYRTRLGVAALHGDGINRASANSALPAPTQSNLATAQVKVEPGVFSDQAIVLGTVFADCNANGVRDPDEPGAPGVRLVMEDGSFVITDAAGRYSLYGVSPRTHVLKLDATTLPEGAEAVATAQRNAGDGNSRFVDPRRGELHRADFALRGCDAGLVETLKARRGALGELELGTALKTELKPKASGLSGSVQADVRGLPAQGLVSELQARVAAGGAMTPALASAIAAAAATTATAAAPAGLRSLESLALEADPTLAFVDLSEGQTVGSLPRALRLKGRAGTTLRLLLNGTPIGDDHLGERALNAERQVELREYVGVQFQRGDNTLELSETDAFGQRRGSRTLHVVAPGELAEVRLVPAQTRADADGQARVAVRVELRDARGLAIVERLGLTLDSSAGEWDVLDTDLQRPGVQTFVEGGAASFELIAPQAPGEAALRADVAGHSGTGRIAFTPKLRPMLAVGIVEGVIDLSRLDPKSIVAARQDDGFEAELRQFARSGDASAGGRAALFLKGKVRGDALLTIGYDSDKSRRDGLFRDIQPDAFYPVYGDASVRGFDAQSTGRLYVRLEKDSSYLLLGDFTTQSGLDTARQLGAYQRSLNGLKQHVETGRIVANVFASHADSRQQVDEIAGNGTSGPYSLSAPGLVSNSERVEILVRDRNQSSRIVSTTPMTRFSDYDLELLSGRLLFRAPVASLDADLNPVSIRITYEVEQGGPSFWIAGADAQLKVTEQIGVGGSFVKDQNPLEPFQLASVNATAKLAAQTALVGELARVERDLDRSGDAGRVELQHDGAVLKAKVFAARSQAGFVNPSATLGSGRSEGGAKASVAIDERNRIVAEALVSDDAVSGSRRAGALVNYEHSIDGGTKVEVGLRRVHDESNLSSQLPGQDAASDTTSVRGKVTTAVPGVPQASVFVEAEQDVQSSDKRLLALGGDYQLASAGRVYLRHELISSLSGPYALDPAQRRNSTVLGIDADVMTDGRLFSEYRGREAFDGRGTEAAIGLRNRWALAEGLRLNTSLERVEALTGTRAGASAAVTGAIEYTADPLWKGTARLELRDSALSRSLLSTFGVARKLDADWTFLGKSIVAITQTKPATTDGTPAAPVPPAPLAQPAQAQSQQRVQLGVAYRDSVHDRVNALGRYEFKRERGLLGDDGPRAVHIVSTHADLQASGQLTLTGHIAAKWVRESVDGGSTTSSAQLFSARAVRDLGANWDVGAAASVLTAGSLARRQQALGAEVGYQVQKNLWVSTGFNITGFEDRDLSADNYTKRGVYLRLRFKFDENLFGKAV